jgi:hypothetical protein
LKGGRGNTSKHATGRLVQQRPLTPYTPYTPYKIGKEAFSRF